jgi:hypothetical protein
LALGIAAGLEEALANLRAAAELYLEEFPLPTAGRSFVTTFEVTVNALPEARVRQVDQADRRRQYPDQVGIELK